MFHCVVGVFLRKHPVDVTTAPEKRYDLWSSIPMDGRNVTEPEIWSRVVDTSHACGRHFAQGEGGGFSRVAGGGEKLGVGELVGESCFNTPNWNKKPRPDRQPLATGCILTGNPFVVGVSRDCRTGVRYRGVARNFLGLCRTMCGKDSIGKEAFKRLVRPPLRPVLDVYFFVSLKKRGDEYSPPWTIVLQNPCVG